MIIELPVKTTTILQWDKFEPYRELALSIFQRLVEDWKNPIAANRVDDKDAIKVSRREILDFIGSDTFALYWSCFHSNLSAEKAADIFYKKLKAMLSIGEIRPGTKIGKVARVRHIYHACEICGKERWVELAHGEPRRRLCRSCSRKGLKYRKNDEN